MRYRPPDPPDDGPPPRWPARARHRHETRARRLRTYVVFAYRSADPQASVAVVGTVEAPDAATARTWACILARRRGIEGEDAGSPSPNGWRVRAWAASACRRSWLLAALLRDGAAQLAAERRGDGRRS